MSQTAQLAVLARQPRSPAASAVLSVRKIRRLADERWRAQPAVDALATASPRDHRNNDTTASPPSVRANTEWVLAMPTLAEADLIRDGQLTAEAVAKLHDARQTLAHQGAGTEFRRRSNCRHEAGRGHTVAASLVDAGRAIRQPATRRCAPVPGSLPGTRRHGRHRLGERPRADIHCQTQTGGAQIDGDAVDRRAGVERCRPRRGPCAAGRSRSSGSSAPPSRCSPLRCCRNFPKRRATHSRTSFTSCGTRGLRIYAPSQRLPCRTTTICRCRSQRPTAVGA